MRGGRKAKNIHVGAKLIAKMDRQKTCQQMTIVVDHHSSRCTVLMVYTPQDNKKSPGVKDTTWHLAVTYVNYQEKPTLENAHRQCTVSKM